MTTLVMVAILVFGIVAYRQLPVSDLPNVDFPTITVNATLPGANPDTMASSVATPLEKQFSTIAGVDQMVSTNTQGNTQITITFTLDRNLDGAAQDVQAMIAKAAKDLPHNLPVPPSYQKVNPADQPILYLAFSSPSMKLSDIDEYAETMLAQRISMVSGVAQVSVFGAQKFAVRAKLDPQKLASRQIGIDEVNNALANGNVNLPVGTLWGANTAYTLNATNGQLYKADEYKNLIVAYRNGGPVRLKEIGTVEDGVENDKTATWYADSSHQLDRAIVLAIQRQPGTNTVEVVDSIRKIIPQLQQLMPANLKLSVLYDRSKTIRESVDDVKFTLFLALMLVILVIFLFLRNISATVIPSLALPFSLIATFAVMYLMGYSLDNLSLMALTLSVGFVVDDAIVMLENIVRHMEMGESAMIAAIRGSREIGFTIVSMTLSLAAVFIPVLFMGGIMGRLLHEFAVTIGVAILVSGFVSLSLTPMMCSRWLKPSKESHHGKFYQWTERGFDAMLHGYDRTLRVVIRHRWATFAASIVIAIITGYLFLTIPKGFLPSEDQGQIYAFTEAQQGTSFDSMVSHQLAQAQAVLNSKEGKYINNFMVSAGRGSVNQGIMVIRMVPRSDRPYVDNIIQAMRPVANKIPGIAAYLQNLPPIRLGGQLTKSQYQLALQSPETSELYKYAPQLEARVRAINGLQDVTSDLQITNPQVNVDIDRDKASVLGVTAGQVEDALYSAYSARQVSTIFDPNNSYEVILQVEDKYQMDPQALSLLYVRSSGGQLVPLSAVAKLTKTVGPLSVNHLGQLPAVTISFNLAPGASLGNAVAAVNKAAREVLPSTITTSLQGTAAAFESSFKGLGLLLIMAILVIYIVLGILYESFIHPLTILSGLPAAGFGALITLMIFRSPIFPLEWRVPDLNIYGFVGLIMLVGIVKKNAIMMIDFALEAQRKEGKAPADAIYEGALVRFRPIMMTTAAALMGTLPIALGVGAGAESRRPLGLAVVGGLLFSQLVTLYITPVYYTLLESMQNFFRRMRGKQLPAEEKKAAAGVGEAVYTD